MPSGFKGSELLVFAMGSAMMGLLAVVLDWAMVSVGRNRASLFGLSYGEGLGRTIRFAIVWGLGAGLGGFLGAATDILQFSRGACFGVGVGWPLILPRLIDSFTESLENAEARQSPEET